MRQTRVRRVDVSRDSGVQQRFQRRLHRQDVTNGRLNQCGMKENEKIKNANQNTLSYGRGFTQRRLASGGQAEATPGAETAQRLRTSDKTVAHCTFLTKSGIMVLSSDLPSE